MNKSMTGWLIGAMLAAVGAAAFYLYAPAAPAWPSLGPTLGPALGFLALSAVLLAVAVVCKTVVASVRRAKTPRTAAGYGRVVLQDGRDYRVDVDDRRLSLTHLRTGEVKTIAWDELTRVFVVAADAFSGGGISYVLHRANGELEVPLGARGNEAFLAKMQQRLAGFDDDALIEGMALNHGFKQVWAADAAAPPAGAGKASS